ncbi:GNAT family N-acetyltransferase [Paenibacillus sp. L3-i20]|uniref:GNAT family N-acetyltransferase n=1 Tax=Paenibacillus sp. L3-i20 TaxID=2905833 RepID=UPI00208D85E9|nr:GNAT family N-acetyltransferase [Paenibacillus sp. L3-i20]GKU79186.1 N-acetyltransferase [Paenibacillus sp. L3-i20]
MDIDVCENLKEAKDIITFHLNDTGCRYGLFSKENNELVGTCGFHCWFNDSEGSRAEIGFDLSPDFWGKGLMQEALQKILNVGFEIMELDYIEATTEHENSRSQKLLEKMGFNREPYLKDNLLYFILKRQEPLEVT